VALSDTSLSACGIASIVGMEIKTGAFKRTIKDLLDYNYLSDKGD
jgi:hypothetical protein